MNRTVAIYSALLIVALVAAYMSWTHEEGPQLRGGVMVLDVAEKDLAEIRYSTEDFKVSITRKKDELGDYAWIETQREMPARTLPVDPNEPSDAAKEAPAPKTVKSAFKGGVTVEPVFAMLSPFIALREMETNEERLKEFGLTEPRGKLEVVIKGKTRAFEVGEEGYGHRNTYVRDVDTKKVYLVDGNLLRPLIRADERLPERRLMEPNLSQIEKITVLSMGQSVSFVQKNAADPLAAFWSVEGQDVANPSAKAWFDKFVRVRSTGSADSIEGATEVLELRATAEGKVSQVKFLKHQTAEGGEKWYVRSNFTRGVVEVPLALAANLVDDFPTLLALQTP